MKVLFTHRYFWPDSPPYGLMLRSLASAVAEKNHDVHVYASRPSYRMKSDNTVPRFENVNGVKVKRGWVLGSEQSNLIVRFLNVVFYCCGVFVHIVRLRPDVVTAATFPPVIAGWVSSLAAKLVGAQFIYHMQDVHPEVSKYSGGFLGKGIQNKFLVWLDNQTLSRSSSVVVLSEDMANTLRDREISLPTLLVINNPPVTSANSGELPPVDYRKKTEKFRIIFAGNLGRFQNLILLTEGIAECFVEFPEIELVFLGDGNAKPELEERWGQHPQVTFLPFIPFLQARVLLEESDVGLVSLQTNIYRVSFPSKMTMYLSIGLPVLVLVEAHSELAKITEKHRLGVVPGEMTPSGIAVALRSLFSGNQTRVLSADWYRDNCSPEANQAAWLQLIEASAKIQKNKEKNHV